MTAATLRRVSGAMLRPKLSWLGKRARHYLDRSGLFEYGLAGLSYVTEKLAPPERRAMAEIAATADLLMIDDRTYIVAEVSPAALDAIAAFDAQAEVLEIDNEDGCVARDDDPGRSDNDARPGDAGDAEGDVDEDDDPKELDNEDCEHDGREPEGSEFGNPMSQTILPTLTEQLQRRQDDKNGVAAALVGLFQPSGSTGGVS